MSTSQPTPEPAPAPAQTAAPGPAPWHRVYWTRRGLLLMMLPVAVYFIVFHYVPMIGLIVAFKDFSMSTGVLHSPWNGLDNFHRLFGGETFPRALRNTVIISFLRLLFGFAAPIVLALMLNELRLGIYKHVVQSITFIPHFLSWVILAGIFLMLLGSGGPFNQILGTIGVGPIPFLTSDAWFLGVLVTTGIWQSVGYGAVIYLAALAGIDQSLYEAAVVDGANRWKQITHITLPMLTPTIIVLLILSLGQILTAGFDQVYNMYNPLVYDTADIIDTYVLRQMLQMDFGLATAAGLFKAIVGLGLIVLVNSMARRLTNGEQGVF